jgi:hypothetical protein
MDDADDMRVSGSFLVQIIDKAGNVRHGIPPGYSLLPWNFWQTGGGRFLKSLMEHLGIKIQERLPPILASYRMVTWEWNSLMADFLGNTKQCIEVGTGGEEAAGIPAYETCLRCRKPVGARKLGHVPVWNRDVENGVLIYEGTFPAGSLKPEGRINEMCVRSNNSWGSECLVYGIMPGVSLRKKDGLRIRVEVTAVPVEVAYEKS